MTAAADAFNDLERQLPGVKESAIAKLVLAEATFQLAEAQQQQNKVIEEGIMYLVRNWPTA